MFEGCAQGVLSELPSRAHLERSGLVLSGSASYDTGRQGWLLYQSHPLTDHPACVHLSPQCLAGNKQCGHAWFPPFPLSTSDPQANLDVARSSWGCRGGEEKDLSKTLSAVSSKTRAAVRWLLTRLVISTLRSPKTTAVGEKPATVYVCRWKYFEQLVGSPHSAHSLSAQDVLVDLQRKQNGQIKVNLMENKKCICQNRKMLVQNFKVRIDPIMHIAALVVHDMATILFTIQVILFHNNDISQYSS